MFKRTINVIILALAVIAVQGCAENSVKRFGQLAQIKPGQVEKYKDLHVKVWPKVIEELKKKSDGINDRFKDM